MGNANIGTGVDERALELLGILSQMPLSRIFDVHP